MSENNSGRTAERVGEDEKSGTDQKDGKRCDAKEMEGCTAHRQNQTQPVSAILHSR